MDSATKQALIKRLKSLAWRAGGMLIVVILDWIGTTINLFDVNPAIVVMIGLILGEVTKFVKSNWPEIQLGKQNLNNEKPEE